MLTGDLSGTGTVSYGNQQALNPVQFQGIHVSPGEDGAGTLTCTPGNGWGWGDVSFTANGSTHSQLVMDVLSAGGVAGTDYDQLIVTGNANLAADRKVNLQLGNGAADLLVRVADTLTAADMAGKTLTIASVTGGGIINGTFANITWTGQIRALVNYNSKSITLSDWHVPGPPGAVSDLAATATDWCAVTLSWTAPADSLPVAVASYDLRYSTDPITDDASFALATPLPNPPTPAVPGTVQTWSLNDRTVFLPATTYYVAIRSNGLDSMVSTLSNVATVTMPPLDVALPATVSLSASNLRANRVTLSWSDSGDDGLTGQAVGYELRYSTSAIDDANWSSATLVSGTPSVGTPGTPHSLTLTSLTPATTYYFAVRYKDEVPNWSVIDCLSIATPDADVVAPTQVGDLRLLGTLSNMAYLVWTAPTDYAANGAGPYAAAGYDLRYSATEIIDDASFAAATPVASVPVPAAPGTKENFTVAGLSPSTTYYFAIKSFDVAEPANLSLLSNVVSDTTRPPIVPVTVHNPWLVNDRVADTHNLAQMAATYINKYTPDGVVLPTSNDEKAINLYNNQKRRYYHWANEPDRKSDPTWNQNVFGWGLCGTHDFQACTIGDAVGFGHRSIGSSGHHFYELNYDGAWHVFDTMMTMYVKTRGTPWHVAGCDEIKADNSLILSAVAENRACPGFLLCGDTPAWYADAVSHWGSDGDGLQTCNWTGNMDLRMGQTFKRTCESWTSQYPTPTAGQPDPPFHHEAYKDYKDYFNFPYWEPYRVDLPYYSQNANPPIRETFRRWSNGTDTLAPDFHSAACQAMLDPASHDIATIFQDGLTPDLHAAAVGVQGEAIFKISLPYYITDASFSGDFVKATSTDSCKVYASADGSAWTSVYTAAAGTNHVVSQSLRSTVFTKYTWYIKVQMTAGSTLSGAGVSNFVVTTTFEHNKGAMAYLDHGVNHITLTFDNAEELAASGNVIHITYKWKEYDGTDWTIDKRFDTYATTSPYTFTITTGGASKPWKQPGKGYDVVPPDGTYGAVPRTEYIAMEITQPDPVPPSPITDLAAGTTTKNSVRLTWTATGDDADSGQASYYDIRYSTSPITDMDSFNAAGFAMGVPMPQLAGSSEACTVTGLAGSTTYYFAVVAYDKGANCSGLSNVVVAATPADPPPAPVADLLVPGGVTKNSIPLSWTATGEDGLTGQAARYDLRYSTSPITGDNFASATPVAGPPGPQPAGQTEGFTVTGLVPATTYYLAIVVYDAADQPSGLSNVGTATTLADVPPAAVVDLSAPSDGTTRDSIQLTWAATGEDGMAGTAARYGLRYSTGTISSMDDFNAATAVTGLAAPKTSGSAETFTVSGLAAGTTYSFALVVYDAANQPSGLSNIVAAATRLPRKLGDVDDDGQVNLADLKLLVGAWNSEGGGAYANWNPDADLDGDNNVNLSDLKILVAHWNQ